MQMFMLILFYKPIIYLTLLYYIFICAVLIGSGDTAVILFFDMMISIYI